MKSKSTGTPAGMPEIQVIRAWPCDSPAVTNLNIPMGQSFRDKPVYAQQDNNTKAEHSIEAVERGKGFLRPF
jgi:hypothetical protein